MRRSTDDGATWSNAARVAITGETVTYYSFVNDQDDTLIHVAFQTIRNIAGDGELNYRQFSMSSNSFGSQISIEQYDAASRAATGYVDFCKIIEKDDGELAVIGNTADIKFMGVDRCHVRAAWSDDNGATWTSGIQASHDNTASIRVGHTASKATDRVHFIYTDFVRVFTDAHGFGTQATVGTAVDLGVPSVFDDGKGGDVEWWVQQYTQSVDDMDTYTTSNAGGADADSPTIAIDADQPADTEVESPKQLDATSRGSRARAFVNADNKMFLYYLNTSGASDINVRRIQEEDNDASDDWVTDTLAAEDDTLNLDYGFTVRVFTRGTDTIAGIVAQTEEDTSTTQIMYFEDVLVAGTADTSLIYTPHAIHPALLVR
jgi:hypothetical protein